MLIDSHCHLTHDGLRERLPAVLLAARNAGVKACVTIGTDLVDARAAQVLAHASHGPGAAAVWFAAGIHPCHSQDPAGVDWPQQEDAFKALWRDPRCVAVGELGLDGHWPQPPRGWQEQALMRQLRWATEPEFAHLPLVVHARKAVPETLAMIAAAGVDARRCVFHCFTEGEAELELLLDAGCVVGFTGVVTYKKAPAVAAAACRVPLERLLVETDAPYLSPEPVRGVQPCEPAFVAHTAAHIARLRGMAFADLAAATAVNTKRVFARLGGMV